MKTNHVKYIPNYCVKQAKSLIELGEVPRGMRRIMMMNGRTECSEELSDKHFRLQWVQWSVLHLTVDVL
jgi:hypothetical protein